MPRKKYRLILCLALLPLSAAFSLALAAAAFPASAGYREISWEELLPPDWKAGKAFEGLELDKLGDNDPAALKAMELYLEQGKNSPPNPELQGKRVKLRGFVVPLDWENELELAEFLLVPYFGACIHVPPPPANQIVQIRPARPLRDIASMDLLQVYGTLFLEENSSEMGSASYRLELDKAEPYAEGGSLPVASGFVLTLLTGLSTALGGLLALSRKTFAPGILCLALSLAAGLMISFALTAALGWFEAGQTLWENAGVFLAGILLMLALERLRSGSSAKERAHFLPRSGKIAALAMGMHNFPEGFALFNAALADPAMGLTLGGAIAAHNIPLGVAVALALYHGSHKRGQALGYALLAGLMQPAGAVLGFLALRPIMTPAAGGMLFSASGGIMFFIAVADLLPAARSCGGSGRRLAGLCAGMALMGAVLLLTPRG